MDCSPPGRSVHGILQQEYWSGWLCPPPGDPPDAGIEPDLLCLLHWQAGSLPLAPLGSPRCRGPPPSVSAGTQSCASQTLGKCEATPCLRASDGVEVGYIRRELGKNACLWLAVPFWVFACFCLFLISASAPALHQLFFADVGSLVAVPEPLVPQPGTEAGPAREAGALTSGLAGRSQALRPAAPSPCPPPLHHSPALCPGPQCEASPHMLSALGRVPSRLEASASVSAALAEPPSRCPPLP